jgi:hypothetical protein
VALGATLALDSQRHRSSGGRWPRTCSTWAPHPAHVVFPHFRHCTALHIPPRV